LAKVGDQFEYFQKAKKHFESGLGPQLKNAAIAAIATAIKSKS
jgi:hypothetical protein